MWVSMWEHKCGNGKKYHIEHILFSCESFREMIKVNLIWCAEVLTHFVAHCFMHSIL